MGLVVGGWAPEGAWAVAETCTPSWEVVKTASVLGVGMARVAAGTGSGRAVGTGWEMVVGREWEMVVGRG